MGERLNEAERDELVNSLRWHFACHAAEPAKSYASLGIENAVNIVEAILAARADRLAGKVRALAERQQREGDRLIERNQDRRSPAAERRWTEGYALRRSAAGLRDLLDDEPTLDRSPLPDRVDAVLRRSRNMREGLVEAIESGELAP